MARSKMKLTIFSRLLIGYLIIFTLVIGMSAYAIFQMSQINEVTQSILTINNRMIDSATKAFGYHFLTGTIREEIYYF